MFLTDEQAKYRDEVLDIILGLYRMTSSDNHEYSTEEFKTKIVTLGMKIGSMIVAGAIDMALNEIYIASLGEKKGVGHPEDYPDDLEEIGGEDTGYYE